MYQLYAYGKKYLDGKGDLFLIYPRHDEFLNPLPVFEFSGDLNLWVVPFDLDKDVLVAGLVKLKPVDEIFSPTGRAIGCRWFLVIHRWRRCRHAWVARSRMP